MDRAALPVWAEPIDEDDDFVKDVCTWKKKFVEYQNLLETYKSND